MRALSWFIGAVLAITVLRLAIQASLAIIMVIIAIALVRAPGNTLKVLAGLLLLSAFAGHPLAGLTFLSLVILGGIVLKS